MTVQVEQQALTAALPLVRGRYREHVSLAKHTWFQVGGPADVLYKPKDVADLATFVAEKPRSIPVTLLGAGSNILIREGGIDGVVIRLGAGFTDIVVREGSIEVGAGCLDRTLALTACDAGHGGLEFFVGIPGTIGGALRMNAGAYGTEVKDVLLWAEAIDLDGNLKRLTPSEMGMTYRHCSVPDGWIFTRAVFRTERGERSKIQEEITQILEERERTQPIRGRTGGSTFKNPPGQKAWKLIDEAGCRGDRMGGAQVSEKHCNFFINGGGASASDIESLGESVRRKVKKSSDIMLEWEIKRFGKST